MYTFNVSERIKCAHDSTALHHCNQWVNNEHYFRPRSICSPRIFCEAMDKKEQIDCHLNLLPVVNIIDVLQMFVKLENLISFERLIVLLIMLTVWPMSVFSLGIVNSVIVSLYIACFTIFICILCRVYVCRICNLFFNNYFKFFCAWVDIVYNE